MKTISQRLHEKLIELKLSGFNKIVFGELESLVTQHFGPYESLKADTEAEAHKNFELIFEKVKRLSAFKNNDLMKN